MTTEPEKQEISLRTVLAACSPESRRVALMWLYYTLFYWLFPTLIIILSFLVAKRPVNWLDLVIHGEFLIYAITITASSTRLIVKDVPGRDPFVNRQGFNLVSHIVVFPAIFIYGLVRYIGITSSPYAVNARLVVSYSIFLLVAAFGFSFIVFLIDAQRSSPNPLAQRVAATIEHTPDKLNKEFDALQGKPGEPTEAAPSNEGPDPVEETLDGDFDSLGDPK